MAEIAHLPAPELRIFCDNWDKKTEGELDSFVIDIGKVQIQNLANVRLRKKSWALFLPIYHDIFGMWNSEGQPTNNPVATVKLTNMYSDLTNFLFNFNSAITASYRRLWVNAFKVEYSLQYGWVRVDVKLDPTNPEYIILMGGSPPALGASLSHLATLLDVSVFKV